MLIWHAIELHLLVVLHRSGRGGLHALQKLGFGRRWEGYRWSGQEQERRPWFKVARASAWRGPSRCTCELRGDAAAATVRYRME